VFYVISVAPETGPVLFREKRAINEAMTAQQAAPTFNEAAAKPTSSVLQQIALLN